MGLTYYTTIGGSKYNNIEPLAIDFINGPYGGYNAHEVQVEIKTEKGVEVVRRSISNNAYTLTKQLFNAFISYPDLVQHL